MKRLFRRASKPTGLTDERLAEIDTIIGAADRGPWRWHGNTDHAEGLSLENREWALLQLTRRERTADDRAVRSYAEYLRENDSFVTPAERLAIDDDTEEDRLNEERSMAQARFELLTDQWGEPAYDVRLRFGGNDRASVGLAEDLAIFQVCRDATTRDDPRVYRADIVGFRNPNATFIAESRRIVDELRAEVALLRGES